MSTLSRPIYCDPLEAIWIGCAAEVGLAVVRGGDAYVHSTGRGSLVIAEPSELDPDDSLAQLIFHELCHALHESPGGWTEPDWGLRNDCGDDLSREHGALHLQAHLARRHGLEGVLVPTTEHRAYYDAIVSAPFQSGDPAATSARRIWESTGGSELARAINRALARSAEVARQIPAPQRAGTLWEAFRDVAID